MGIGVTIEMRVLVRLGAHGVMEFWAVEVVVVVVVGDCRVCRVWSLKRLNLREDRVRN